MVELHQGSPEEWDRAVATLPGGNFCHLHAWTSVFADTFGHETRQWVVRDAGGRIHALLPLVRMRSLLFGHSLLSMPFLNYGGPIGDPESCRALIDAALDHGRRTRADRVELRARARPPTDAPIHNEKVTVLLPLPDDAETLWTDGLKAKVRSQVRRPMKEGMTTEFGAHLVDDFYRVFARNMRDLGTPVLPRSLFTNIARAFPEQMILAVVRTKEGAAVAAGCGFLYRGEFELTWASALREFNREAPNMLLYWALMEEVIRRGGRVFNFGRCTPGGGTHRFKLQWGGEDQPLHWVRWAPRGEAAAPSKERGIYARAVTVWQRLPVPVANVLGPLVSRGLPSW
ncbi:MAG: FemAB family PEP-CTERM system-associated protein [Longimicrobiales bacterium]|nr:FemAB family PEP-CTERM system-associated protein [Longimicrobiales bacterium]